MDLSIQTISNSIEDAVYHSFAKADNKSSQAFQVSWKQTLNYPR
jgi:hypothetical protein